MSVSLIIPAAGRSSRFPGMRPKWLLTHPSGCPMVVACIKGMSLKNIDNIYLAVLKDHIDGFATIKSLKSAFKDFGIKSKVTIVVLDRVTQSQPETIAKVIEEESITGPIFIKDVDNYFEIEPTSENCVASYSLTDMSLVHAKNKSYITLDDNGNINNIVEKKVIGAEFCVGGYSFQSSIEFLDTFHEIKKIVGDHSEIYPSHIIFQMIANGSKFTSHRAENYIDWGTLKEWTDYRSKYATIFVDLDGVLVENSSRYFKPLWGKSKGIEDNIFALNRLHKSGKVKIIITTARSSTQKEITKSQLKCNGILYDELIMDLPHAKRIIINDFSKSNPYKSCDAINIQRNENNLRQMLEDSIGIE